MSFLAHHDVPDGGLSPQTPALRGSGWNPTRRALTSLMLMAVLPLLASCGFKPVHSREQRVQQETQIESVQIVTDNSRYGQLLKAEIEDQVNPDAIHAEKPFVMTIHYKLTEISLFINPDGTSSRGDMQFSSDYAVTRKIDGKIIDTGAITRVSSYNISETADYATYVSREDASRRGVLELAQDYKLRLANLVPKLNNPTAGPAPKTEEEPAAIIYPQDNHESRATGF